MSALTITDFVLKGTSGQASVWVQLRDNLTPTTIFTSAAATNAVGQFSITGTPPPPADYSAYTSSVNGPPWTLYDPHFRIAYTRGDDAILNSLTIGTTVSSKSAITPIAWDATYRAAMAAIATTPFGVCFTGDSITQGYTSTDFLVNGYQGKVASGLLARPGVTHHGTFYALYDSDDFVNAFSGAGIFPWPGTPPWTVTINPGAGGPRVYAPMGFTLAPVWLFGAVAQGTEMARFTAPFNSNAFDIVFWNLGAGTWWYSIDNGATTPVVQAGAPRVDRIQIRGLGAGNHTVKIMGQSAAGAVAVLGVMAYNTQTGNPPVGGVWFARLAWGGATISALGKTTTGNPVDHLALFANPAPAIGPPLGASLAINAWGAGDCVIRGAGAVNSPTHFKYNLRRYIQACRQAVPHQSQLGMIPQMLEAYYSDVPANPFAQNIHLWSAAKASVLAEEGCAFLTMQEIFGQKPVTDGLIVPAGLHPTNAGHILIANAILALI